MIDIIEHIHRCQETDMTFHLFHFMISIIFEVKNNNTINNKSITRLKDMHDKKNILPRNCIKWLIVCFIS